VEQTKNSKSDDIRTPSAKNNILHSAARMDKPSLSVCMIVKNEADLLPRCLASLRDIAAEIVLVDTGSIDRTKDIAKEFDCRIVEFPWTGDFAAARNESMKYADQEWIFIIDADEELPAGAVDDLRAILKRDDIDIVSLTVVNKSLETGRVSSILPSIRLFRRNLGLQYEGIVHNRLAIPQNAAVVRTAIELYHYGYDLPDDKLRKKQARSRELLERQLQKNPDDVFANFNMAQLLMGLHGTADENISRTIVDHAARVIANHDPAQTGHTGYFLMAHYQTATALCALRRYEEAESFCRAALDQKDDYLDIILTLANIRLARSDMEEARKYYLQYLEMSGSYRPDRERNDIIMHHVHSRHIAAYGLATISRLENNIDDALKYYRRVIRDYGPYLDTCLLMGVLYLRRGEPARAEEILTEEITQHPESAAAHIVLAKSLEAQGRGDRGIERLQEAHAALPQNVDILFALAAMLVNLGRIDEGVSCIKRAVELAGNDPKLRFRAAGMFFEIGDFVEAADNYRTCLEQKPLWPEAYANLGNCHFRQESYEQAAACYETALGLAPDNDLARRNLGLAYARSGKAGFALAVLKDYVERHGDDADICRLTGDLSLSSGQYATAVDCYEKCLRANPSEINCLFHLAEAYRAMGQTAAAEAGYRHLLSLNPDFEPARRRLEETAATGAI
jgi:tetratricopeptide (TPR) repeat protein